MVSIGQVLNERYKLLSLEGEGGMAIVYKAQDLELERIVALKVLRAGYSASDAFRREARAAANLPHPNIVAVHDVREDGDVQYIVMEYIEGQSLQDVIRSQAPLPIGRALDIVSQICEALSYAHGKRIIHCDIKPQNVLVLPDGRVKVTDFGIARAFSSASPEQRDKVWGTPYYAPPELITGKPLTPASDVYAIGVMLYEMLSGQRPFEGQTAAEIARQHVLSAPPPIHQHNPRIPRYVQQVIDRALNKDPSARYQTAGQLRERLAVYRQHSQAATQPLQAEPAAGRSAARPVSPSQHAAPVRELTQTRPRQGVDWLMMLLGGLAFLAVMGLLPIWGTVLSRAFSQPTPAPTPISRDTSTPIATLATETIQTPIPPTASPEPRIPVPDLGRTELEEAQLIVRENALALAVVEQRHDSEVPASYVISQDPAAGELVPLYTQIRVVLSLGPELVTVPDVTGFPAVIKELDLEDLGLLVVITEAWSTEPAGLVITQTPAAGTEIGVGTVVTLTVSSGPRGEVRANLGDKLLLFACELNETEFRPGDAVQVIVTWHVLEQMSESYDVFIHIIDRDGRILTQRDEPPLGGSRPTNTWQPAEKLLDPHTLSLPPNAAPGVYQVYVGMYRGDRRLAVVDPGFAEAKEDAILVREIRVRAN